MAAISRIDAQARLGSLPDAIEADNDGLPAVAAVRHPTGVGRWAGDRCDWIRRRIHPIDPFPTLTIVRFAEAVCHCHKSTGMASAGIDHAYGEDSQGCSSTGRNLLIALLSSISECSLCVVR
jgi:hypothetical protein